MGAFKLTPNAARTPGHALPRGNTARVGFRVSVGKETAEQGVGSKSENTFCNQEGEK